MAKTPGAKSGTRRSTIYDVAQMSGVTAATVSHVLNHTATISGDTKARVLAAIETLGYRPNANARALRTADTRIVGILVQDISSEYYAQCAAGILQSAQKEGFAVLTIDAHFKPEALEKGVSALVERCVNGLIFVGGARDAASLDAAEAAGVPVVFGDRYVPGYPCVEFDNYRTMYGLAQALVAQGYEKFRYLGEDLAAQQNLSRRFEGLMDGLRASGVADGDIEVILRPDLIDAKMQNAYQFFRGHLDAVRRGDGRKIILTSNDMLAQGVITALLRGGIRVPEDIAVFGFDNISIAIYATPSISTVVQDPTALGRACFDLLLQKIRNPGAQLPGVSLPQTVAIRESAPLEAAIARAHGLTLHEDP